MFILKEGVDYKVKITFKVRAAVVGAPAGTDPAPQRESLTRPVLQVNKEIVSGLKCLHHTYRQGLRGELHGAGPAGGEAGQAEGSPHVLTAPQWIRPCTWWAVTAQAPTSTSS